MAEVVAIGGEEELGGLALIGARVVVTRSAAEARAAWGSLPPTVGIVVLGLDAERAIGPDRWHAGAPLTLLIPGPPGAPR